MRRILKASALLAAVTLVAVTGAGAALSPSYQVAGIEFGAQQATVSPFTGLGVGSAGDRGFWQASVTHDALETARPSARAVRSRAARSRCAASGSQLNGSFTGGSYQLTSAPPGCGRQQFALTGNLTTAAGPMALTAVLTNYRFQAADSALRSSPRSRDRWRPLRRPTAAAAGSSDPSARLSRGSRRCFRGAVADAEPAAGRLIGGEVRARPVEVLRSARRAGGACSGRSTVHCQAPDESSTYSVQTPSSPPSCAGLP